MTASLSCVTPFLSVILCYYRLRVILWLLVLLRYQQQDCSSFVPAPRNQRQRRPTIIILRVRVHLASVQQLLLHRTAASNYHYSSSPRAPCKCQEQFHNRILPAVRIQRQRRPTTITLRVRVVECEEGRLGRSTRWDDTIKEPESELLARARFLILRQVCSCIT